MEIILLVITVLLLLFIAIQSIINKGKPFEGLSELENTLAGLQKSLTTLETCFLQRDFQGREVSRVLAGSSHNADGAGCLVQMLKGLHN